ncbi:hypothetical protein YC2023_046627 [Brassica napus]
MFNTKFHVVIITLNLVLVYAGGRLIPPGSVPSTSMKSLSVDDTINLNPKNQIFRGAEVKSCKPKGFRPRSAPSRFVNYQPLVSVKCSSSKNTEELNLRANSLPGSLFNNATLSLLKKRISGGYTSFRSSYELEDIFSNLTKRE